MALELTDQQITDEELYVPPFEKPIPGESLTNNPENPAPFESPPEITKQSDGINTLFLMVTDEDVYPELMNSIRNKVPLSEIAQYVLFEGFTQGKWNPDMVLLLFEPLVYMLMGLSEKIQLEYVLYPGEDKDDQVLNDTQNLSLLKEITEIASKELGKNGSRISSLPSEIQTRLAEFKPVEETIEPVEETIEQEEATVPPSLLSDTSNTEEISLMQKQNTR